MAWSSISAAYDSGSSKTAGTTLVLPGGGTAPVAGDVMLVAIAKDNIQTTDGNTSEVTSCTDNRSNTYTPVREFCNGQAAAGGGAVAAIFYSIITSNNLGIIITVNFSASITARAATVSHLRIASGSTITILGNQDLADDAADTGSMTISGLASQEYLFVRATAHEGPGTDALTATTNYTAMSTAGTTAGGAATNMSVGGEYRILTGTGDTSNPTWTAADHAATYVALRENVTVLPTLSRRTFAPLPFMPRSW